MADIAAAAYQLTTNGVITTPHAWQSSVYERLSLQESDAGYLILTPTGAGKTEAVTIPGLGMARGGAPRRLFVIGPETASLDDYIYRLVPYLKTSAQADGIARTVYVDTPRGDETPIPCRRFLPEGGSEEMVVLSPLEADVDLVLTSLPRFSEIFFGGGGLHALPSALTGPEPVRRDLFFFDEAHAYTPGAFDDFQRLTEFLFAADMDVVVGSSTMSPAYRDELAFLEPITVPYGPASRITLEYRPQTKSTEDFAKLAQALARPDNRTAVVCESAAIAIEVYTELTQSGYQGAYLYVRRQPAHERRAVYEKVKDLESEGKGYLLVTTGAVLESADISTDVLITSLCTPESLILRAGRCARHGSELNGQLVVTGDTLSENTRLINRHDEYIAALKEGSEKIYEEELFKEFV